jgi:hypothetical protein
MGTAAQAAVGAHRAAGRPIGAVQTKQALNLERVHEGTRRSVCFRRRRKTEAVAVTRSKMTRSVVRFVKGPAEAWAVRTSTPAFAMGSDSVCVRGGVTHVSVSAIAEQNYCHMRPVVERRGADRTPDEGAQEVGVHRDRHGCVARLRRRKARRMRGRRRGASPSSS